MEVSAHCLQILSDSQKLGSIQDLYVCSSTFSQFRFWISEFLNLCGFKHQPPMSPHLPHHGHNRNFHNPLSLCRDGVQNHVCDEVETKVVSKRSGRFGQRASGCGYLIWCWELLGPIGEKLKAVAHWPRLNLLMKMKRWWCCAEKHDGSGCTVLEFAVWRLEFFVILEAGFMWSWDDKFHFMYHPCLPWSSIIVVRIGYEWCHYSEDIELVSMKRRVKHKQDSCNGSLTCCLEVTIETKKRGRSMGMEGTRWSWWWTQQYDVTWNTWEVCLEDCNEKWNVLVVNA